MQAFVQPSLHVAENFSYAELFSLFNSSSGIPWIFFTHNFCDKQTIKKKQKTIEVQIFLLHINQALILLFICAQYTIEVHQSEVFVLIVVFLKAGID